jgi:N-acetylglutamate synthase-like GNAT family acetyltransferase
MIPTIFPMNRNDLAAVADLSEQLGYPLLDEHLHQRFEELSGLPQHALFVLKNEQLLGWVHLELVYDLIEEKKVEIKAIVVDEKLRGQGHGQKLLKASVAWAKAQQVQAIFLSCNIVRDKTHAFYLKEGFTKTRTSHFFEIKI